MNPILSLKDYVVAISLLLAGATINHLFGYLQPKSKLVYWNPHSFLFDKVEGSIAIHTQTYTIQNLGRKVCENIQIVHRNSPDHFRLQPERQYSSLTTPSGEHVIQIDSLAPKEFFSVEILSYKKLPQLLAVRSKDGSAQPIKFFVQQVQPKWKSRFVGSLIILGMMTTGYVILKAIEYFYGAFST